MDLDRLAPPFSGFTVYFFNLVFDVVTLPLDPLCGEFNGYNFLWAPVAIPIAILMAVRGINRACPSEVLGMNKQDCMQRVTWTILTLTLISLVVTVPSIVFAAFFGDRVTMYMLHVQYMPLIVGLAVSWLDLQRTQARTIRLL